MTARSSTPPDAIRAWVRSANRWAREFSLAIEKGASVPPDGLPVATAERLWAAVRLQRDLGRKLSNEQHHLRSAEAHLAELRARILQHGASYEMRHKGRVLKGAIERHSQRVTELAALLAGGKAELDRATVACYTRARHLETGRGGPAALAAEHPELAEGYADTREAKRTAAEERRRAQRKAEAWTAAALAPLSREQRRSYLVDLGEQAKALLADGVSWDDARLQLGLGGDWLRTVREYVNKSKQEASAKARPPVRSCANCLHGKPEPRSETGFVCLAEAFRACKPWGHWLRWEAKP